MLYDNILGTIGRTPIVRINRLSPPGVEMYVKVESFNPMASVKDRLAHAIVLDAEQRGILTPNSGQMVVEATSGNTGTTSGSIAARTSLSRTGRTSTTGGSTTTGGGDEPHAPTTSSAAIHRIRGRLTAAIAAPR